MSPEISITFTQDAFSPILLGDHLAVPPESTAPPPVQSVLPAIPRGPLPPVGGRRPNHGAPVGFGFGTGIGTGIGEHQQNYDDGHRWTPKHHRHQEHQDYVFMGENIMDQLLRDLEPSELCHRATGADEHRGAEQHKHQEGVMGGGIMDQLRHGLEPSELRRRATGADERGADDASRFLRANEPTASGDGGESGIPDGGGPAAREQPPAHSAEGELLGRETIAVKRSDTAARPMSVRDTTSRPPGRSKPFRLQPPLAPLPQVASPHHQPLESGGGDKDKSTFDLGSPDTARDTSDAASQAPGSPERQRGGQRLERACQQPGCGRVPSFGEVGQRAVRCTKHKLDGVVKSTSRMCAAPGCTKGSSFGAAGDAKPVSCFAHRSPGHVNVVSPRCAEKGCHKRPSFGYHGGSSGTGRKATYCAEHKLAGMANVLSRSCEKKGCRLIPSFGFEGERATACWRHKQDGQQNVVLLSRRCAGPDGITAPTHEKPGARGWPSACATRGSNR